MIFARVPERGKVKTRLAREVGDEKALELYEAMLRDLVDSVGASDEQLCVEIVWNGTDELDGATVRRLFPRHELSMQCGRDLGERLLLAFHERVVFHQAAKVVAIGSDDPTLTREIIDKAFLLLESCDWVIGPASDGGYYLIGCRAGSFDIKVFQDIAWGTAQVLPETIARLKAMHQCVALLPTHHDLDVSEDVREYSRRGAHGRTLQVLKEWGWVA